MKKAAIVLLVCFFFLLPITPLANAAEAPTTPYEHVILIVVDGVRPDVLLEANTPNIDALTADGSYTWNAWTVTPSVTIKAIPSIYTGATPEVHGVTDWEGEIYAETLTEVFNEAGLVSAIVGNDDILGGYSATYSTGYYYSAEADKHFTDIAIEWFVDYRPFFLTIYNPMPDRTAHDYGHESAEYREVIESADFHIGRLVDKLKELGVYERTLIVITPDHGMTGTSHGGGNETDMRIFSIWHGPGVKRGYEMVDNVSIPLREGGYAGVRIHAVDNDSWSEFGITWNNQPELGDVKDNGLVNAVGWYSWDVTSFVAEQFTQDGIASIAMVDADENLPPDHAARFETKDWWDVTVHPYLEVQYSPPGESVSTIRVESSEDSYVRQDVPDSNFGWGTSLWIGRYLNGAERAFLKFDLGAIPAGSSIIEAKYYNYCWNLSPATGYKETDVAHRIIDIAPTITELVGLRPPENAEGEVIWQIFGAATPAPLSSELPLTWIVIGGSLGAIVAAALVVFYKKRTGKRA